MPETRDYYKNAEFLLNYSWKGKSKKQIISDMQLDTDEQRYLDEAIYLTSPLNRMGLFFWNQCGKRVKAS